MKKDLFYYLLIIVMGLFANSCDVDVVDNPVENPFFTSFCFKAEDNPSLDKDVIIDVQKLKNDGMIKLFVPHLITDSLVARFSGDYDKLTVKGVEQISGESSNDYNVPVIFELTNNNGGSKIYTFLITGYNGLPIVHIDTENNSPIVSKEDYLQAIFKISNNPEERCFESECQIRGRGNSTWRLSKKPYRIKFKNKQKLLGEGYADAKNWTLLANHSDKSLIRNALTRELGLFCGFSFNPAAKFVDLFLNGEYQGTYQVSDQMEVHQGRIEITKQNAQTSDSDISGGYFLEFSDKEAIERDEGDKQWFTTEFKDIGVLIKHPDKADYKQSQISYIQEYINTIENSLFNVDFDDVQLGYHRYLDEDTFINWYICVELSANVDGMYSTYLYKEKNNEHLFWGPLWDNDIAWNNCFRKGDFTNRLVREDGFGNRAVKVWLIRAGEDPWFLSKVNKRWKELINSGIDCFLYEKIDSLSSVISFSVIENYKKYSITERNYDELKIHDSYNEYINDIKDFIHNRIIFLSDKFNSDVYASQNLIENISIHNK